MGGTLLYDAIFFCKFPIFSGGQSVYCEVRTYNTTQVNLRCDVREYGFKKVNVKSVSWVYDSKQVIVDKAVRGMTRLSDRQHVWHPEGVDSSKVIVDSEVQGTTLQKLSSIARYEVRLYKS